MARKPGHRLLRFVLNLYPPYLGAGIRVTEIAADFRRATVEMPLRWYNRNSFGTHFGGSLYAMTDPFFALLVRHNLSPAYRVWDRAASITFVAPGRGRMRAEFTVTDEDLATINKMTAGGDKHLHLFKTDILDAEGLVVARVDKVVYVRRVREAAREVAEPRDDLGERKGRAGSAPVARPVSASGRPEALVPQRVARRVGQ